MHQEVLEVSSQSKLRSILKALAIPFVGSLFLAVMSQLSIPLAPVPVSLQTFALFLMAGLMGSRRALQSVGLYLFEASCGLPVLAGGVVNPLWILTPRAGFLIGFAVCVYFTGKLLERKSSWSLPYILLSLAVGQIALYVCGVSWLSYFVGFSQAIALGVIPFVVGAGMKLVAGTCFLKGYHSLLCSSSHVRKE